MAPDRSALLLGLTLIACQSPASEDGDGTTAPGSTGAQSPTTGAPPDPTTGIIGEASTGADAETSAGTTSDTTLPALDPLPPLASPVPLTDEALRVPLHAVDEDKLLDPRIPAERDQMIAEGYGDVELQPGEPVLARTLDDAPPPAPGPSPALLTRFVHLADTQLADDESPARLVNFDAAADGAFRPGEGHICRMLNAAARTINRLHQDLPIEFVLLGGDNTDNAQDNELTWFMDVLDGAGRIECDSAEDDDPIPGPANDPKDPFASAGLDIPWRWVTGNHDLLRQGSWDITKFMGEPVGTMATGGTRDYGMPGSPIVTGTVLADPARHFISEADQLARVAGASDGHGITADALALGRAFYTFDIDGTPLRFFVMSTAAATGSSKGLIRQTDIDAIIEPTIQQAAADDKWLILTSHHRAGSLYNGTEPGLGVGMEFADALTTEDWIAYLGGHPHVLMHLAAHSHVMSVYAMQPMGGHAYWEMASPSLTDFPSQMRLVEIWDQDNDHLTIRSLAFDYAVDGDPVADAGRTLGVADFTSSWVGDGRGAGPEHRNVELWIPKP